jgi:cation diffusion facilitator family transporter
MQPPNKPLAPPSEKVIGVAFLANLGIAAAKFVAAFFSQSSGMLSEAIHSLVDTANEILLFIGIRLSKKPPDELHPLGYGLELYFWTLIVAIVVFAVGGGMSIYEGITHIIYPQLIEDVGWTYLVLAFAFILESYSLKVAWARFQSKRLPLGIWQTIHRSKDPTYFTVLLEDTAALFGIILAFLGVFLSHWFRLPVLDGLASIAIGILLSFVAVVLAIESRSLLIGERTDLPTIQSIHEIVKSDPDVKEMAYPVTAQLGPDQVLLNLEVHFSQDLCGKDLEQAITRLEQNIKKRHPKIKYIFIEARSMEGKVKDLGHKLH